MTTAKKKTSKQVTVSPSSEVIAQELSAWGLETEIDRENIIPPAIRLCQSMSERVQEGLARPGQMIDTLSGEVLGDYDKPILIIPFLVSSSWRIFINDKYDRVEPVTKVNKHAPLREQTPDGDSLRRDHCIDVWVLLADQLAAGTAIPYMVTFARTSHKAGKKIETRIFRNLIHQPPLSPAAFTMTLHALKKENDKGRFAVYDVNDSRRSTEEEQLAALKFYKELSPKMDDIPRPAEDEFNSKTLF